MGRIRSLALVIASMVITLLALATGTADAAPVSGAAPSYLAKTSADNKSIITTLTNATFARTVSDNSLVVLNRNGDRISTVPLTTTLNGVIVPLRQSVSADRTQATLTPDLTASARAAIAAGVHPASAKKDRAWNAMVWHITNGWNNGGAIATAVGALIGLVVGCLVILGCLWAAGVGAAIGAVIGIYNGDPYSAQAILNWINTP